MTFDRRTLFTATGAMTVALVAPRFATPAAAKGEMPTMQVVGAQRHTVGDAVVTALSDGYIKLGADAFPNATLEDIRPLFDSVFMDPENFNAAVNAYLVDMPDRRVLIDAGGALGPFETLGRLSENLKALGIDPASIDALLVTHLHPDHIGGAMTQDGAPVFANAEMIVRGEEVSFWRDDANVTEGSKGFFQLARKALDAYEGNDALTIFGGDTEVLPGFNAWFLPGHTPGHTGYMIDSGGEQMLVWGDIVHMPPVQFAKPDIYIGFDVNPDQAVATRRDVLAMAQAEKMKVAGMHHLFPGFGNIAKGDGETAYYFVEAPFQYEI